MSIKSQECSLDNHTITWTVTQCQYSHRNVFCTITPLDTTLDQVDPLVIVLGWGFFPDFYDPPTPTFFLSFGPAITPPPHFFLHNHVKSRYFWPHPHIFSHILHSTHSIPPWIKLIHLLLYWVGDFSRIFMTPLPPHFFYLLVQLLPHPHIFSFIIMLNHGTFDPTPTFFHISCTPPTFYFANHSHIRTLQSREWKKTWRREFLCVTSFRFRRSFPSMAVT